MAFIDKAVSAYGRLDAIWANGRHPAAGGLPLPTDVEHWQEILRINLIGRSRDQICHAAHDQAEIRFDRLHRVGRRSESGASGHPYAASKAGVISLVQTTAYIAVGTG